MKMNLATDPWIPVVWRNGQPGMVSLAETFQRGEDIQDLAVRPHERIALMRLLICVAQAALDGPKDHPDWQVCRPRIAPAAADYLKRWRDAFELFGDKQRFLQSKGRGTPGTMELQKLDFVDADMPTLFNQEARPEMQFSEAWIALHLVTYQSFAAGGTVGGAAVIRGRNQPQKGKNGPCRDSSAFHAFVRQGCLIDTIHANLLDRQLIELVRPGAWGRPVWELKHKSIEDYEKHPEIVRSYMGRLVPVSRSIWLNDNLSSAENANGLDYPSFSDDGTRETTVAVRVVKDKSGQERRVLVSAVDGENVRRPWRELHAIIVKRIAGSGPGGPLALARMSNQESFDLWVGAVATDQAKIMDSVESVLHVRQGMLTEPALKVYEDGVRHAEHWEARLRRAIGLYRLGMETTSNESGELIRRYFSLKKVDKQRLADIGNKAHSGFWTTLEQNLHLLEDFVLSPLPMNNGQVAYYETEWGRRVQAATVECFTLACPHGTPRQMRAFALARQALFCSTQPDISKNKPQEIEA